MFRTVKLKGQEVRVLDLTYDKVEWRIEHETRGIFVGWSNEFAPMFRYSIIRTDPDAWVTRDVATAEEEINRVMKHAPKAYLIKMFRRHRPNHLL